jgi:maltooligosyltrehalose trehalohydrolase
MLFQGEEWCASTPFQYFTDHEPELGRAVSEGRRREFAAFGWKPDEVPDPQAEATFAGSILDWSELERDDHAAMLHWYTELIALRRAHAELADPRLERVAVEFDAERATLVVTRGSIRLLVNLGTVPATFEYDAETTLLARSDDACRHTGASMSVPPDAVAIVRANPKLANGEVARG